MRARLQVPALWPAMECSLRGDSKVAVSGRRCVTRLAVPRSAPVGPRSNGLACITRICAGEFSAATQHLQITTSLSLTAGRAGADPRHMEPESLFFSRPASRSTLRHFVGASACAFTNRKERSTPHAVRLRPGFGSASLAPVQFCTPALFPVGPRLSGVSSAQLFDPYFSDGQYVGTHIRFPDYQATG